MGPSVHDEIGDGRIRAMPCSDSQPRRNVSVAGFVAGGAGGVITQIAPKACCTRLQKRHGGRHTAMTRHWLLAFDGLLAAIQLTEKRFQRIRCATEFRDV